MACTSAFTPPQFAVMEGLDAEVAPTFEEIKDVGLARL